jgi:hypothetical protein
MTKKKYNKYTKEQVENAVKNSTSWRGVITCLNPDANYRGSESNIKKTAIKFGITFDHFPGSAWNRGRRFGPKKPIEDYFNGEAITSYKLKKRILNEGLKEWKCEKCLNTEWLGEKIPLELHHIDCNPKNNQFSNLKLVCPNCHYKEHNPEKVAKENKPKKLIKRADRKKKNNCQKCGAPCRNKYCSYKCSRQESRKVKNRPAKEELEKLIWEKSTVQIAKTFGVSDKAIENWCKQYGIAKPPRGYWAKQKLPANQNKIPLDK